MNKESLLAFAKAHPAVVADVLIALGNAAKADPTVTSGLLDVIAGTMTFGDFAKTHKALIASLLADLLGELL